MDALIDLLLDWISQNSQHDTSNIDHPVVRVLSPNAITTEMYTGVAHLIPDDGVDERINALYAHGEDTIYILDSIYVDGADAFADPTQNPLWREILLHELVHHVQWETGLAETWMCDAQGELEAYHLGGVYLEQQNTADPLPNRAFWARMYSRC